MLREVTPCSVSASRPPIFLGWGSVFEGSTAAGSTDEIFEEVAVDLPESSRLCDLSEVIHTKLKAEVFEVLCIVAHGSRQQGEGVIHRDASLYDMLTETFEAVLAV